MRLTAAFAAALLTATSLAAATPASAAGAGSGPLADPQLLESIADASARRTLSGSSDPSISVELLHHGDGTAIAAGVLDIGGTVTGRVPGAVVEASVPLSRIGAVASIGGVDYIRGTRRTAAQQLSAARPLAGSVQAQAVAALKADVWHAASYTGKGVRIGILGVPNGTTWSSQQASGDVPALAGAACFDRGAACVSPSTDPQWGMFINAIAEVVHDIAPEATIYTAGFNTASDLSSALDYLSSNKVKVVIDPFTYEIDGAGDGTGPFNAAVSGAIDRSGMLYLKSGGNEGQYQYWQGAWVDADNDGWIEFAAGDETLDIAPTSSGCYYLLGGRWNEWTAAPALRTNYDFYLYENGAQVTPNAQFPAPNQTTTAAPPVELDYEGNCGVTSAAVKIRKRTAGTATTAGDVLEVFGFSGEFDRWQRAGAASTPVTDSRHPGVIAIGGVDAPPTHALYPWSSNGPTRDGRIKPDFVSYHCANVSLPDLAGECIEGTYVAAATVGGVAALLFQARLSATSLGIVALLQRHAANGGPGGFDNQFGKGIVRLPALPVAVGSSPAAYTPITPIRLLDSRSASKSPPGTAGQYAPNTLNIIPVRNQPIPGTNPAVIPVPANATAVAINLTLVNPLATGFTQAMPYLSGPIGGYATLNNAEVPQTQPNFAIVPLGQGGRIALYTTSGGHYVIDILGYFAPSGPTAAGRVIAVNPTRVLDTRSTKAALLPAGWTAHKPAAKETITYNLRTSASLPLANASAVALVITGVDPTAKGFVTVFPNGQPLPVAAMLNLEVGKGNRTNMIIVPIGTANSIKLYTSGGAHFTADLVGYVTNASVAPAGTGRFVPITPGRMYDSRVNDGRVIVAAGARRAIATTGVSGVAIPATGVSAVSVNLAATRQVTTGSAVIFANDLATIPGTASLSWLGANFNIGSAALVRQSADNKLVLSPRGTAAHLIVDANGYFTKDA